MSRIQGSSHGRSWATLGEVGRGGSVAVGNSVAPEKPLLRGWMHLVWFEACLVLGTLALVHTHGAVRITGLAIFVVSVSAMFGVSAFYHRGNWSETWRVRGAGGGARGIFLLRPR